MVLVLKKEILSYFYIMYLFLLLFLQNWKTEAEEMNQVLEHSNAEAQKMCAHKDADMKYAAFKKRWVVIDETAKG